MNIRLDHKRALVTGGNSGIGEAIALGLADAGAKVTINYVTHPEAAQLLVHRIKDRHGEAIALQADVSDPEAISQMFGLIDEAWGGIDILINNAGADGDRAFAWQADIAVWRKVIEVNLFGVEHDKYSVFQQQCVSPRSSLIYCDAVHKKRRSEPCGQKRFPRNCSSGWMPTGGRPTTCRSARFISTTIRC